MVLWQSTTTKTNTTLNGGLRHVARSNDSQSPRNFYMMNLCREEVTWWTKTEVEIYLSAMRTRKNRRMTEICGEWFCNMFQNYLRNKWKPNIMTKDANTGRLALATQILSIEIHKYKCSSSSSGLSAGISGHASLAIWEDVQQNYILQNPQPTSACFTTTFYDEKCYYYKFFSEFFCLVNNGRAPIFQSVQSLILQLSINHEHYFLGIVTESILIEISILAHRLNSPSNFNTDI